MTDHFTTVREADAIIVDALLDGDLTDEDLKIFNKRAKATWALVDVATINQFVKKRKKDAARIFDAPDDMVELFFQNQWMKNRLGLLAEYLETILDEPFSGPELNAHLKFIREFK